MPAKAAKPQKAKADSGQESLTPAGCLVVAVGASAGGLDAITELLHNLPDDTGMAFVFIQHLDPLHQSMLTELISRETSMKVVEVTDGMVISPNCVYVIPPNRTMSVSNRTLLLTARQEIRGVPMPIDFFMRSLAEDQGPNCIGIILSGGGSDGTLGLTEIQAQGGVTFAQDPSTAKHDAMPHSAIVCGAADLVLPPNAIAQELVRIARHPFVRRPLTDRAAELVPHEHASLNVIFNLLRKSTGVDFTYYRDTTIRRRIQRRMVVHKIDRLQKYVKYLTQNPEELNALYNDMLINVTSFFRNQVVFEALKTEIFPQIMRDRPKDAVVRFWTPGCASGQETYSLAIAFLEYLGDSAASTRVQLFGTDVSEASINKARAALYPKNIEGDVSPERLRRFFTKVENGYRISKTIRDMCIFSQHNVISDPPFSQIDLISCRNLLIYLEPVLQKKVIALFHYALRPTGYLVLGTSEGVGLSANLFSIEDRVNKIFTKRPSARPELPFSYEHSGSPAYRIPQQSLTDSADAHWNYIEAQKEFDRRLLRQYAPAAVFVNSDFEVLHSRGSIDGYLKLPPGRASLSVLKMAREGLLSELQKALNAAKKDGATVRKRRIKIKKANSKNGEQMVAVDLEVVPVRVGNSREMNYMIIFEDARKQLSRPSHAPAPRTTAPADRRRLDKLEQELASTKEYLHSVIESQEATNEELQSANEEILSSNEELQSTNEELETAEEELQSTNEELSTVNDELRNRNREITQINSDLTNLLASTNVGILMLSSDLTIRRFTPAAQKVFGLISADVGRPFTSINPNVDGVNLQTTIHAVLQNLTPANADVKDREGRPYSLQVLPYRTIDNKIDGVVITVMDTQSRAAATTKGAGSAGKSAGVVTPGDAD